VAERNVSRADVRVALQDAKHCIASEKGGWKATGKDLAGIDLDVVVVIENGLIVVTLF